VKYPLLYEEEEEKKTLVSELSGNRATRYTRRVAFNNDSRQLLTSLFDLNLFESRF
jgi:hypothetical protein